MPVIGFADVTIDYVENTQQKTSVVDNIIITKDGQINVAGADAVQMDAAQKSLTIHANNIHPEAIIATTSTAVNIIAGATQSTISIGSDSEIFGALNGIIVNASKAQIQNAGIIEGNNDRGIFIDTTGTDLQLSNSGTILGTNYGIYVQGTGSSITNSGLITSDNVIGIYYAADFKALNNTSTGQITGTNNANFGLAIVTPLTGEIFNSGLITSSGPLFSTGIYIVSNYNGSITNSSTGTISATGANGQAIAISASFDEILNSGIIEGTNTNYGIRSFATVAGTITNSGIIRATGGGAFSAIELNGGFTAITNTGQITAAGTAPAIEVTTGSFTDGITNSGTISSAAGVAAIKLSTAGDILLTQNAGTINGDVLLAGLVTAGFTSLQMNGGTINGNVFSSTTNNSTLNLAGGTINGDVNLGSVAGNILNLSGTRVVGNINGGTATQDTFNLSGGSFIVLDGNGGLDIVNVTGSFTLPVGSKIQEVEDLNTVNNGTVFTVRGELDIDDDINVAANTSVSFASTAVVDADGTLDIANTGGVSVFSNNVVVGDVDNDGRVNVGPFGILTVDMGNYVQSATGSYAVGIQGPLDNGLIDVTAGSATLAMGSTINPYIVAGTFIPDSTQYDILQTTLGVTDNSTLVQPSNPLIFFVKTDDGLTITLTANLNPIQTATISDIAQAVATALDPLFFGGTTNPELLQLFGQLQALTSVAEINSALEQLAPPFNYAMIAISHIPIDNAFDSVQTRLEWLKGINPLSQEELYKEDRHMLYNGVSYGDWTTVYQNRGAYGAWAKIYGTYYDQMKRYDDMRKLNVDGWTAESTGYAFGIDWAPSDCFVFGVAGSYTQTSSKDETAQQNTIDLDTYLATFYSWYQITDRFYMDAMAAIGSHEYDMMRNISIGTLMLNAQGQPYAFQYGGQVDVGYVFLLDSEFLVAPVARARYTHLDIGTYTEIGAGGLNLQVENDPVDEQILGVGLRMAMQRDYVEALYVLEGSAMILYDFAGESQQTQAIFMGGSQPFYTSSINPRKFIQLYGVSLSAYTSDNYAFTLKLNFEHREQFFAYNGYMQLNYSWG